MPQLFGYIYLGLMLPINTILDFLVIIKHIPKNYNPLVVDLIVDEFMVGISIFIILISR